jgi:ubiquinone/menaquinone biosynthesis C-methylase UbiE
MSVLDVGCGTGAITVGIARITGPRGEVLGVDRDDSLLAIARRDHQDVRNLSFQNADALSLPFRNRFDIVTAARTLQWVSHPGEAVVRMKNATKSGGRIVALDYNHENNSWTPDAPAEFSRFYRAFLDWRQANGWDNRIADHLPVLFRSAGMVEIQTHIEDETVERGDGDFSPAAAIWTHVIETLGPRIVAAGFLDERHSR